MTKNELIDHIAKNADRAVPRLARPSALPSVASRVP